MADKKSYIVEAILTARDQGYASAFQDAAQQAENAAGSTKKFRDTMMGMAAANVITKSLSKAWNLVTGSVDKAMGRIDTMANFERTMSRITGSSDNASAALKTLNGITRGTAYGLDVAAKSTQDFVLRGKTVDEATESIAVWGDAVAFYGDGSNQQFASVTEAISKMLTRGRVDMQQMQAMFNAGIDPVSIYADATGQMSSTVQAALSNGSISAQDFFKVVEAALSQGTASFQSVSGAAKSAGSNWATTIANMKAATTRGVVSIIDQIESARSAANLPTMKESVAKFGQSMERILKGVGKVFAAAAKHAESFGIAIGTAFLAFGGYKLAGKATDAIKKYSAITKANNNILKQSVATLKGKISVEQAYAAVAKTQAGAEQIRNAAKKVGIALDEKDLTMTAAGTALTSKQTAAIMAETGALSAKGIITALLSGKIGIATAAQLLWNAAMAANPIGAVIAAVAAFVGVLAGLNKLLQRNDEEHKKANKAAKEHAESLKSATDNAKNMQASYRGTYDEIKATRKESDQYVKALRDIAKSSDDAATKSKRTKTAVTQLKRLYPDLKIEIDETTGAIKGNVDAIEAQMDAMDAAARKKAYEDALSDNYKSLVQLETQLEASKKQIEEMEAAGTHYSGGFFSVYTKEYKELVKSVEEGTATYEENRAQLEILQEQMGVFSEEELKAKQAAEEQARSLENLKASYGLTTEAVLDYVDQTGEPLEEAGEKIVKYAEQFGMSSDEIIDHAKKQGLTLDEWAKKHEDNLRKAENFASNYLGKIANGWESLEQKQGISLTKYMANLKANAEASKKWRTNVEKLMKAGVHEGIIAQLEELGPAGAIQAQKFVDELERMNGNALGTWDELSDETKTKIGELNSTMESSIKEGMQAVSHSMNTTRFIDDGLQIKKYVAQGMEGFDDEMYGLGVSGSDGFIRGIRSQNWRVKSTAQKMADAASKGVRQSLKIASPSRVMTKYGNYTGEGFAAGLSDKIQKVMMTAKEMARAAIPETPRFGEYVSKPRRGMGDIDRPSPNPAELTLVLGNRSYRAFVDDLTHAQDQKLELQEVYGYV